MKNILFVFCMLFSCFCVADSKNENALSNNSQKLFKLTHPYAFYLLTGGDYNISDTQNAILGISIPKYNMKHFRFENSKLKLYSKKIMNQEYSGFIKENPDMKSENFSFNVYKKLSMNGYYIVHTLFNSGGSLTFSRYSLVKIQKRSYFNCGRIENRNILLAYGELGKDTPDTRKIEKMKLPEKIVKPASNNIFRIHPCAFFYLSNPQNGIICVNATKFLLSNNSNEVFDKTVFVRKNKIGFIEKEANSTQKRIFYFSILKQFKKYNSYIVKCVLQTSQYQRTNYLLLRLDNRKYYDWGKWITEQVLTCEGYLGTKEPAEKEITKIENLLAQGIIGEI